MDAQGYFDSQAHFNKWLKQLTEDEQRMVVDMLNEFRQQNLQQCSVSGWLEFEKQMPDTDKLILVTNGQFVEICYYENERLYKPWRFDEDDRCAFRIRNVNDPSWVQLWWRVIELPTIH